MMLMMEDVQIPSLSIPLVFPFDRAEHCCEDIVGQTTLELARECVFSPKAETEINSNIFNFNVYVIEVIRKLTLRSHVTINNQGPAKFQRTNRRWAFCIFSGPSLTPFPTTYLPTRTLT